MSELDRKGRRTILATLAAVSDRGPITAEGVSVILGGDPESVARRLRRYRRRGWCGVSYGEDGPAYFVREAGAQRLAWIVEHCTSDT